MVLFQMTFNLSDNKVKCNTIKVKESFLKVDI